MKISFIVPVYNRPGETEELLESMTQQSVSGEFEVIIVEDGSSEKSEDIVNRYADKLEIKYFFKDNSGPGPSRNYGCERASGDYMIFLDSDVVLPEGYYKAVIEAVNEHKPDNFGGPDRAHKNFSRLQKAINFSMTSFLTTGGIRGGGEKMEKFHPRSFNMGISRAVYEKTGGFSEMRFGEDVDLSIRIAEAGFKSMLVKDAYVYHKRRTNLRQFFKQVYNSGIARINLYKRHPGTLKIVHTAPAIFTLGLFALLVLSLAWSWYFILPVALHIVMLFLSATIRNRSLAIGVLGVAASYTQLIGYGTGFLKAFWRRIILGGDEFAAFRKNFYS